jgi:Ca-activated chloride channel family protein
MRRQRALPSPSCPHPAYHRFAGLCMPVFLACGLLALTGCGEDGNKHIGPGDPAGGKPRPAVRQPAPVPVAREHDTEAYAHFVDNPVLAVDRNPLSTFSIDLDTASYSNMRRFLVQEHRLPPPDAVRIADMINYFSYSYPQPENDEPVAFALDIADCPWNSAHHLARIALKAREIPASELPPRNFVFLVDTSGSMDAPNRLPLLKESLEMLVARLTARDRVAIVTYAGYAGLALPSTPGDRKGTILAALHGLHAAGSTNGGEGIVMAYRVAAENFIERGLNRVILGTDGDFNVGVTSEGELVRLIEQKRKTGVYLTILGFGMGNLKNSTMEKLAEHGNGHYAYIDTPAEAYKVFVEQGAALVTVAKDVKVQVEFNPKQVAAYRLIGYENRLLRDQDFNDDARDAGDMGAGHTVTALYELTPAGEEVLAPGVDPLKYQKPARLARTAHTGEWLTVKLRYKDPDAETSKRLIKTLSGPVQPLAAAAADFRFAAAVAGFGMLLRNSDQRGDFSYEDVARWATAARGADPGGHRAEFIRLVGAARAIATHSPRHGE